MIVKAYQFTASIWNAIVPEAIAWLILAALVVFMFLVFG